MSRKLALESLQLSLGLDGDVKQKTKNEKNNRRKNKSLKKNTSIVKKQISLNKKKQLEKNVKNYQQSLAIPKNKRSVDQRKLLDLLMGGDTKRKQNASNDEMDDDMDFTKSILFDDDVIGKNAGADNEEEEEGAAFGEWNKQSRKKEKTIFVRTK